LNIYDYGIFLSHLEIEVAKSKRYGYNFSVMTLEVQEEKQIELLRIMVKTGFRMTDVITKVGEGRYIILLNATRLSGAEKLLDRISRQMPYAYSLRSTIVEFEEDDTMDSILNRLHLNVHENENLG
jgi:hypothetical protein